MMALMVLLGKVQTFAITRVNFFVHIIMICTLPYLPPSVNIFHISVTKIKKTICFSSFLSSFSCKQYLYLYTGSLWKQWSRTRYSASCNVCCQRKKPQNGSPLQSWCNECYGNFISIKFVMTLFFLWSTERDKKNIVDFPLSAHFQ